jgi:hypothetical protein
MENVNVTKSTTPSGPVVAVFDAQGMLPAQYGQVMRDLEQSGEAMPDGRKSHFALSKEGGMMVVDLWESPEKLERFASILIPILIKNGVKPPLPQVHPLINQVKG